MRGWTCVPLLALALAGCLADDEEEGRDPVVAPRPFDPAVLSQPVHGILPPEEVWVTASDGQRINNAVYRPDTNESVPVFINFSPYWSDSAMEQGDAFARHLVNEYVPRGYAVVLSAVRGTGHSEGCFEVGSDRESLDVNEVVDYFSKAPWSNGNVAAGGKSYDSTSQNGMVAKFPHPALKGIFHVSGITDMYSYTFRMGTPARADSAVFTWEYGLAQGISEYAGGAGSPGSAEGEGPDSLARAVDDAACVQLPMGVANAGGSTAAGAKTPYWVERDWTRSIAGSSWNGSIFFVHGLQDWNVQPSHILPWLGEVEANGGIRVLGWLHQWTNGQAEGEGSDGHVYPMRTDWNQTMLRWLDATLKGKDTHMGELWGYEVQGTDFRWRRTPAWPPVGGLEVAVADDAPVTLGPGAVRVSGAVLVNVTATSTHADPVLTAVLYDEGNGTRTWIGEAVLRGVYRASLEQPTPVTPGAAVQYTLESYALDHVFEPGHSLVVDFGANPQQSVPLPQQQGVAYGAATAHLPTAPLDLVDPQPVWMRCFAC